jgi:hypothetical protein
MFLALGGCMATVHTLKRASGEIDEGRLQAAMQFPDWQREFEAAVREKDHGKLAERLQAAKAAIFSRLRAKLDRPPGTLERIVLNDAIHFLRLLRSKNVPYPDRATAGDCRKECLGYKVTTPKEDDRVRTAQYEDDLPVVSADSCGQPISA